jgi:hypothetical protein
VDPETIRVFVARTTKNSGVPELLEDPVAADEIAVLLRPVSSKGIPHAGAA